MKIQIGKNKNHKIFFAFYIRFPFWHFMSKKDWYGKRIGTYGGDLCKDTYNLRDFGAFTFGVTKHFIH